ncbi:MAG: transcriptional regulator [Chloroflexi bacterium]|nr:transcriptional regulator [Chloroflexota bacterium]
MATNDVSSDDLQRIAALNRTIHAPARLMILALLSVIDTADFTFLMTQTGLTRGNLSTHLKKLEEAEYINVKKEFVERIPRTLIRLTDEGRDAIKSYRDNMQQVLTEMLS